MAKRPALTMYCAVFALVVGVLPAAAQTDNRSGCTRDVTRLCRAVMNDGDFAVLACLKEHRARLSKTCQKVLTDNNQ